MSEFGWGLALLGGYVLLVVLARWVCIARSNVVWTRAQSEAMGKRLSLQAARAAASNGRPPVSQQTLQQLVDEIVKEPPDVVRQVSARGAPGAACVRWPAWCGSP